MVLGTAGGNVVSYEILAWVAEHFESDSGNLGGMFQQCQKLLKNQIS